MSISIIFCLTCFLVDAMADVPPAPDDNIHINADSIEQGQAEGVIKASGHVVMTWQGLTMTADRAVYDNASRILTAQGNVTMKKGKDVVRGEAARLNLETNLGEMDSAILKNAESNMTVSGNKIIRSSENEFEIQQSELTTCDMPNPSWKFKADNFTGNILGYAVGKHVIFYVKDIPVLYIPWIAFPVVRDKTSGLLFPRLGYSNIRGAQIDIPVYWVISPSQDAQLDVDVQSKRGVGLGVDYRYIRTRGSEGHAGGYMIYDQFKNELRGQISQSHKEIFSPDMNLRMDVNINSDRTFLSDFGEKSGDYNRQTSDTNVNFLKTWQTYALTSHLNYSENLYAKDDDLTVQTLPEFGISGVRHRVLSTPLYFDLDSNLTNLYRESETSGQRLHVFPRVSLVDTQVGIFNTTFWGGVHLRGYNTDSGRNIRPDFTVLGDRISGRNMPRIDGDILPEVGARASVSLNRVYQPEIGALQKLRHELVPEISYSYQPEHNQSRLPSYDYTDRMIFQNTVWLSATSLISGKYKNGEISEYRDLSRIRLMQGYSFEGTRRDLLSLVDTPSHWTDLKLESDTWVHKQVKVTLDATFDVASSTTKSGHGVSSIAPGVEFDDHAGNLIGGSYRMSRNEVEYFEGRVGTKLIKPLILNYSNRYSFDKGEFLESVYSAEYKHKCWSVILSLRGRPGNQSVMVNFNLAGLMGK